MKNFLKRKSGITLIALVITIIVMLILAGVGIAMLTGDNGVLTQSSKAKLQTEYSTVTEGIKLKYGEYEIKVTTEEYTKDFITFLQEYEPEEILNSEGEVIVENLIGKKLSTGNGSEQKDVYVLEEVVETAKLASTEVIKIAEQENTTKKYVLKYYDNKSEAIELDIIQKGTTTGNNQESGENEVDEVIQAPAEGEYAFSYKVGENITAYLVKNESESATAGEEVYDMLLVGTGEMYSFNEWKEFAKTAGVLSEYKTSGGSYCSYGANIISAKISNGITSIGEKAFSYNNSLKNVVIPSSVTSIGNAAFSGGGLETVEGASGVISIGNSAFSGNYNLKNIKIPSIQTIGDYAFTNCQSIEKLVLPLSLNYIGVHSLDFPYDEDASVEYPRAYYMGTAEQWKQIESAEYGSSELYREYVDVYCNSKASQQLEIGGRTYNSVHEYFNTQKTIGEVLTAPAEGEYTKSFKMGDNITAYIVENSEASATAGETVYDMLIVGTGEMYAFDEWKEAAIAEGILTEEDDWSTYYCGYNIEIINAKISKGITNIGEKAFYEQTSLETIVIPDGITSIGASAFQNCGNLKYIEIPNGVATVDKSAFKDCYSLEYMVIPASVNFTGSAYLHVDNMIVYYGGTPIQARNLGIYWRILYCDWGE